ncbi:multidrug transporter MatE [Chitinispirillum alkaliphilum]|nr:multidrug transporter MatE [Chitinispirillum alkaliphilum]
MKHKISGNDLTSGSIPRHLFELALPMLIGNLLNTSYSIIDAMWVGRIVGKEAIGAIAVSFPVIFIFISAATGATIATTILVSQYYGAKKFKLLERTVNTSFALAMSLGMVLSISGVLFADWILHLLGTPETIFPLASSYLKISFMGFTVLYMSHLVTSILRGIGDTRTPLLFIACGVAVNAVLDPLLIIGIGPFPEMGLNGAALASLISSFIALSLGLVYLRKKGSVLAFRFSKLTLDIPLIRTIFTIGFPSMLQQSAVSLGMATVISYVNSFGDVASAAYGAAWKIESVAFLPAMSIGLAVSALTGQNLGAEKIDRVHSIFKWGIAMTVSVSLFFSFFFLLIPEQLLSIFTDDQNVIAIGRGYLRIVGPSTVMFAIMYVSNGIINGAGHTTTTLMFTVISLWGVRVPLSAVLSQTRLGITGIWIAFSIGFATIMSISLWWYYSGKWKRRVIKYVKAPAVVETSQITNLDIDRNLGTQE